MAAIGLDQAGVVGAASTANDALAAGGANASQQLVQVAPSTANVAAQVWMPVKHAAREAGVPERSAFRWAKKGVIPVRRSGKVQLVEVSALKAYASRPVNGVVGSVGPEAGATVAPSAAPVAKLASVAVSSADVLAWLKDVEERLSAQEMVMEDVWMTVFGSRGSK